MSREFAVVVLLGIGHHIGLQDGFGHIEGLGSQHTGVPPDPPVQRITNPVRSRRRRVQIVRIIQVWQQIASRIGEDLGRSRGGEVGGRTGGGTGTGVEGKRGGDVVGTERVDAFTGGHFVCSASSARRLGGGRGEVGC